MVVFKREIWVSSKLKLHSEVEDEGFSGKQKKLTQQQLNKFAKLCNQSTDAVLDSDELADSKKLGAWKISTAHLLNDIAIMRNVCKNQDSGNNQSGYWRKKIDRESLDKKLNQRIFHQTSQLLRFHHTKRLLTPPLTSL